MAEEARHPGRIQISNKRPLFFYVGQGKRLLEEHGEIQLTGLGFAISTLVTVAELLKRDKLAVERKINTSFEAFTDEGLERHKPKLEVVLVKSPEFDAIIAEQKEAAAAKKAAAAQADPAAEVLEQ